MVPPTAVAEGSAVAIKDPVKDTILTPSLSTPPILKRWRRWIFSPNEAELEAICEEFRKDYNRHHFVRNGEFEGCRRQARPGNAQSVR